MEPKILFTSPCGPYAKLPVDKDPIDYFYYRNTYQQKMFQLRSFQSWHSLHFMAQNIALPSVVIENPSMRKFQQEINKGHYEIVAIGFTILLTKKVLEMVSWLKQTHPGIEIVLGGYGTAIFKESFETSDQLQALVDHICYGEGVSFMNAIILKKWNIQNKQPLRQDLLPSKNSFFRTHIELFQQIILTGGLGCVYGCSFCATSSQFKQHYIPLFTGKQLFDSLHEQHLKHPKIQSAIIYEEDFLLNRAQFLEFSQHFQNSPMARQTILLTVFASVKSILNYRIEELIACGIGTIFIGVESLSEDVLAAEGLSKRNGEVEILFEQLHAHGINTLGSLIIGWDSQTEEIARADSEGFIQLNPTFYQVVPLHVVPGTQLWDEMKQENRIPTDYKVELDGITDFNFEAKSFSHSKARNLVFSTYTGLVQEGGPWPFRLFENVLKGYVNLKEHENAVLKSRALIYRSMIYPLCFLAFASSLFFYGKGFRQRWKKTMKQFYHHFPFLLLLSLLVSPIVAVLLLGISLCANLVYRLNPNGDQPDFVRVKYEIPERENYT
ncbi:MAG: radical SAM protein [Prolixibacteraceae bacterium]